MKTYLYNGDKNSFKIPVSFPTVNKSIRFPDSMIAAVELEIIGTGCTFSAFVVEAVRVALISLKIQREKEKQEKNKSSGKE